MEHLRVKTAMQFLLNEPSSFHILACDCYHGQSELALSFNFTKLELVPCLIPLPTSWIFMLRSISLFYKMAACLLAALVHVHHIQKM